MYPLPWQQHIKYLLWYNYYELALSLSAEEYQNVQTNISQKKSAENLTYFSTTVSCRMQRASQRPARPYQPGSILYSLTQTGRSTTSPSRATQSKMVHEFPLMWVQRLVSLLCLFFTSYPPELLQGHPHWSLHKVIPCCFISLPLH